MQHQIKTGQMCFHIRPSNEFQITNTVSTFFKPDPNVFRLFTSPGVVEVYRAGARSDAATYRNRTALHFSANAAVVEVKTSKIESLVGRNCREATEGTDVSQVQVPKISDLQQVSSRNIRLAVHNHYVELQ